MHLLWLRVSPDFDQRLAIKFLRGQLNLVLNAFEVQLQDQPYDHVVRQNVPASFVCFVQFFASTFDCFQRVSCVGRESAFPAAYEKEWIQ